MVRTKGLPLSILPSPLLALPDLPSPLRALTSPRPAGNPPPEMALPKCHMCALVMDRPGEKRPSVKCKQCKEEFCGKCAKATAEFCSMMKSIGKSLWVCDECEAKGEDMKSVIESMRSIKTELCTIQKVQTRQDGERSQIVDGLKAVEAVVKKMEKIEETQDRHEQRINSHESAIAKNARKGEEGEDRLKKLEERIEKIEKNDKNGGESDLRQFNTVVQEVREIEKREKNIVVFNVPESTEGEEEEERRKADYDKIKGILNELACDGIIPSKVIRIGKTGRHPKQILVIFRSVDECESVLKKSRDGPKLKNEVFLTRDRTFKQRQEAKQFREEKEKEENNQERNGELAQPRGGGRGRGRSRGGRGRGGGRGGVRASDSGSRKRRNSDEPENLVNLDEESKRRRTGGGRGGGGGGTVPEAIATENTPSVSSPNSELGAVGGADGGGGGGGGETEGGGNF